MLMRFRAGDVVRLMSGGPDMTVTQAEPGLDLFCQWFNEGKLERASLNREAVQIVDNSNQSTGEAASDFDPFK